MTYIAFDHHQKWTQATAIDDQGKIIGYGSSLELWSYLYFRSLRQLQTN